MKTVRTWPWVTWLALGLALGLGAPAQAQTAGQWRDSAQLWRATCALCHGVGVGPELLGRPWTPAVLTVWLRHGPGAMPTFAAAQISDAEIAALAHWVSQQPAPVPNKATP